MFYGGDVYDQRCVYTRKAAVHGKKCTPSHNCHESVAERGKAETLNSISC